MVTDPAADTPAPRYTWRERLRDVYEVEVRARDGARYRVVAHRKGFPVSEPTWRIFVPPMANLLWEVFRGLRFRARDLGQWTVEIHRLDAPHNSGTPLNTFDVASRREAFARCRAEAARLTP